MLMKFSNEVEKREEVHSLWMSCRLPCFEGFLRLAPKTLSPPFRIEPLNQLLNEVKRERAESGWAKIKILTSHWWRLRLRTQNMVNFTAELRTLSCPNRQRPQPPKMVAGKTSATRDLLDGLFYWARIQLWWPNFRNNKILGFVGLLKKKCFYKNTFSKKYFP